jgi:hypothetical protein
MTRTGNYGPWFVAGYEGSCAGCGGDIIEGDMIRSDGENGYLCEDDGVEDDDD